MKTRINLKSVALIIAVTFTIGTANATGKVTKASSHENIVESSLNVESWMTSEKIWDAPDSYNYAEAREEILNVEDWMTNTNLWSNSINGFFRAEESNLELEAWMTNDLAWDVVSILKMETENEGNLNLENWMINEQVWNR